MLLSEMAETLKREFPNQYVAFSIDVIKGRFIPSEIEVSIYTEQTGWLYAESFEQCVAALKIALNSHKIDGTKQSIES